MSNESASLVVQSDDRSMNIEPEIGSRENDFGLAQCLAFTIGHGFMTGTLEGPLIATRASLFSRFYHNARSLSTAVSQVFLFPYSRFAGGIII